MRTRELTAEKLLARHEDEEWYPDMFRALKRSWRYQETLTVNGASNTRHSGFHIHFPFRKIVVLLASILKKSKMNATAGRIHPNVNETSKGMKNPIAARSPCEVGTV